MLHVDISAFKIFMYTLYPPVAGRYFTAFTRLMPLGNACTQPSTDHYLYYSAYFCKLQYNCGGGETMDLYSTYWKLKYSSDNEQRITIRTHLLLSQIYVFEYYAN